MITLQYFYLKINMSQSDMIIKFFYKILLQDIIIEVIITQSNISDMFSNSKYIALQCS